MNKQVVASSITEIIQKAAKDHPRTLFSRKAFQLRVYSALEPAIDQAIADLVEQGIICNIDCSSKMEQAAFCLTGEHGGCPDNTKQFLNQIKNITSPSLPNSA